MNYDNTKAGFDIGDRVTASTKSLPVGTNKSKDFPYTSSVTNSIDFIMDVNGKGSLPSVEKLEDIRTYKTDYPSIASSNKGVWSSDEDYEGRQYFSRVVYLSEGGTYSNKRNQNLVICVSN